MKSEIIAAMTPKEIIAALQADTPLNRVRQVISNTSGRLEQESMQRNPISPIEIRRIELQAANEICALFGIGLA